METWYSKPREGQYVSEGKTTTKRILKNETTVSIIYSEMEPLSLLYEAQI
jgi:hypothetical protein